MTTEFLENASIKLENVLSVMHDENTNDYIMTTLVDGIEGKFVITLTEFVFINKYLKKNTPK